MSIEMVQSRIADIQARFPAAAPAPAVAAAAPATAPEAASGADFGAQLQSALRSAGVSTDATTGAVSGPADTSAGERAVATARKYLGVPYVWGGTTPKGFDCSGLVQHVFKEQGIDLPRTAAAQARVGRAVSAADARPGDIVAYDNSSSRAGIDHIGIYIGGGKWIAAPHTGTVVKVQDIDLSRAAAIRRVVPDTAPTASASVVGAASATASSGLPSWAAALPAKAQQYVPDFVAAGKATGVDPRLLAAVAWQESGFNASARSGAGATGLMQLMPATARGLGVDPRDPAQAALGAAKYLSQQLKAQGGRVDLALAAYNAGPGAVKTYGGVPPYAETRTYISRVTGHYTALGGSA